MSKEINITADDVRDIDDNSVDTTECSDTDYEHRVYLNALDSFEEAKRKRGNYRKYGTLFIILSAVFFLALIFSLETKIDFLILWVITDFYCAALMIRSEYRCHQLAEILCIPEEDEEPENGLNEPEGDPEKETHDVDSDSNADTED